jgi:hypothetical protein
MVTSPILRLRMAFPFALVVPATTLSRRAVVRVIALSAAVCPPGCRCRYEIDGAVVIRRGKGPPLTT